MANLNKVFLIGRLTHDPELRYTPGGAAVSDLRLAINRRYTGRDGESREDTLFIDVTVWNRQAEHCCQYLKKGRQVHVEGYLRMDTWEDKTGGGQRSKIKVESERVEFLDSRRDELSSEEGAPPPREPRRGFGTGSDESRTMPGNGSSRSYPPTAGNRPTPPSPAPASEDADDDIPF